jgi:hypothetical protein
MTTRTTAGTGRRAKATVAVTLAIAAAAMAITGCGGGGGPAPLSEAELLERLEGAGLQVEILGEPMVSEKDRSLFVAEPVGMLAVRLSDGQGNAESMTLVHFPAVKDAAGLEARPVNGFAARNWFFLGIIANHFRDPILAATS